MTGKIARLRVTRAVPSDLPRILEIQKLAYLSEAEIYGDDNLPPLHQTLEEITREALSKTILKAIQSGSIVGTVRAEVVDDTCRIGRLAVDPQHQGRGIGSALLAACESAFPDVRRFELFTGNRSQANIRLYERRGYRRFKEEILSRAVNLVFMEKYRTDAG